MASSPIIDWALLGRVVLVSLLAGVGLVAVFSLGLVGLSAARSERRGSVARSASGVLVIVAVGAIVAALWWGIVLITNKS